MDINAKTFPVTNEDLINSEYASGDVAFISAYVDDAGEFPKLIIPSDWPVFINTALVNKNQIDDIYSNKGRLLLSRNQFASLADNKQNLPETERMHHLQKAGMNKISNDIVSIGTGCLPQIAHSFAETQHMIKAIIFDVFGTLAEIGDRRRPYARLLRLAAQAGRTPQPDDAARIMSMNGDIWAIARVAWIGSLASPVR